MTKYSCRLAIVAIFVITLTTRLLALSSVPSHLSNDEISIAYDAYSISKTLRDQHNQLLPIAFESFCTYKAPLSIYLTVIPTIIFGNNEYSARLISAILGILTVFLLGLLVFEITKNKALALITSFILSITPWHIYTSRMILEANVGLFFVITGLYLLFYGSHHKNKLATILSFISFALSMYSYHTEWIFTPLLIIVFYLLYVKNILKNKVYIWAIFIFFILVTPLFINYIHNLGTNARANTELVFSETTFNKQFSNPQNNIIQKTRLISDALLGTYSSYINFGYLFFNGLRLIPAPDPYQVGLFLTSLLPCLIIGSFSLKKYFKEDALFLYAWAFISPLVPALTQGGTNFVRNLTSVAPYTIIIAAGATTLFNYLQKKKIILYIWLILTTISLLYFLIIYFYHFPKENGENFQYGYKQIAVYIKNNYSKYNKIVIDPKFGENYYFDGVPYLYIPYFTYLPPRYLQNPNHTQFLSFDKYEVRAIKWGDENILPNTLYVVPYSNRPPEDMKPLLKMLWEIKLPNGREAFQLYAKAG